MYDAYMYRTTDTQWNTVRNGTGEGVLTTNPSIGSDLMTSSITNNFDYHYRGGVTFNTTGIPAGATITNATITGYGYNHLDNLGLISYAWMDFNPTSKTSYTAADYSATTFTRKTDYIASTEFHPGDQITWTINDLSSINKGGLTSYMLESEWMINGTSPVWTNSTESYASIYGKQFSNSTFLPYLTVNYTTTSGGIPIADFTSDKQWCTAPCTIQFTDASANNPTTWLWSFTNETSIYNFDNVTTQSPIQTFPAPGLYNISLLACNDKGCDDTLTKISYIYIVNEWADFTSDPYPATLIGTTTGQNIQFIDTSVNSPTSWAWYWFDNETVSSTLQNPVGTFCVGNYSVRLKATGANTTGWHNQTDYVSVGYAPTSHFTMGVV
jgi:PKD repeat protein